MKIEPGMLCRIVCNHRPGQRDRIVTTVRRVKIFFIDGWIVDAPWLATYDKGFAATCLRPIHDPNIDLSATTVKRLEKVT